MTWRGAVVGAVAAVLLGAGAVGASSVAVPGTAGSFTASVTDTDDTAASRLLCGGSFDALRSVAFFAYPLDEAASATTAADAGSAGHVGTYRGAHTVAAVPANAAGGGCHLDGGSAYSPSTSTQFVSVAPGPPAPPTTFSVSIWFRTSATAGRLIGYGSSATGTSSNYDRHLYLTTAGAIVFGTYNSGFQMVTSAAASPTNYASGTWHQAVGVMSPTTGMQLYVDGALVDSNAGYTTPEHFTGSWRVGQDSLASWPSASATAYSGDLRYAAVYTTALSAAEVLTSYTAGL